MSIYSKLINMDKTNIKNYIEKIDIYKYMGKGKLNTFIKDHGIDIYNKILKDTEILDKTPYKSNKFLSARLIFLKKYNGDIFKIKNKENYFIFKSKHKDFINTAKNSAFKQWESVNNKLKLINKNDLYSKENTIKLLKENKNFKNYLGKSKNRTLLKHNPILYKSIYYHTENMNNLNNNLNKLSHRIFILINDIDIYCKKCKNLKFWKIIDSEFKICCSTCSPKFPTKEWFKKKYGNNNYKKEYDKYFRYIKSLKTNSFEWYITKYGKEHGKNLYKKRYLKQLKILNQLKQNKYSMISQELFWDIYKQLNCNDSEVYFQELNNEYMIRIPDNINYDKNVIFVDFKYKNNIIEYNGTYWHNKEDDCLRKKVLEKLGYNVLVITSDEYNRNKKDNNIIKKSIKFLYDN